MYNLLKNKRLILSLPLFLAASLLLPVYIVPLGHASPGTGLVCITTSTTATSCPTSAPTIGPLTVGQTFSVGVFIQGSDAMGGFDIYVRSDPSFVNPTSAALGTLIASPSLTSICVNGVATTGSCTAVASPNGPGVVEVTTAESSGSNECGGISPCSGMAFTITYQVVGSTPSTALSYPSGYGACATSSVASPPETCVLVDDAFGTPLSENIQGATVTISLPQAVVCITYPSTVTSCPVGAPSIPVTVGSSYTVGVFVQNSAPMGGFDVYVQVDAHYLNPTGAALGTLIASPTNTNICMNGQTIQGQCTGPINGNGVVEVSTVESSGLNECPASPCSGLAFTITYQVLLPTPSTPISYATDANAPGFCSPSSVSSSPPNVCVSVNDATGPTLTENIQSAFFTHPPFVNPTKPGITCGTSPGTPAPVFQTLQCTVVITDTNATGAIYPINPNNYPTANDRPVVIWTTDGFGVFQPVNTCTIDRISSVSSSCSVSYLPLGVGNGTHNIGVIYKGDTVHSGSTAPPGPFSLQVSKANVTISTVVVNVQTGQPVNASGVPARLTVRDTTVMNGGAPPQGVSGTVTYTIYPNGGCTAGTGTVVSTVTITANSADNVPNSGPAMPPLQPTGNSPVTDSFNAVYSGDSNNNAVTSACEPFTVVPAPSFAAGKLHWTHHLSLSKSSNTQSWTAIVANPFSTSVRVVVRIVGSVNGIPSLTFDITCGVTCVNTASGGVNFTPGLTPVTVAGSTSSLSISFNQLISSSFANQKVTFTATLYWASGTLYNSSDSKSGAFAVVP